MIQTFSPGQVVCRPALERDLAKIKEFCKTIWDGHDYIQYVIEDWFQDEKGIFAVAEYEGHAIACSKLTLLAEGQWWLEGFRVDPNYQGRKVGSLIHHYLCNWWLDHGDGVLRLMTNSRNKSVHHLCEQTGFARLFEVRGYKAKPVEGHADVFTPAASNELPKAIAFARSSPSLALTRCLADFGWRLVDPTQDGAPSFLFPGGSSFEDNFFWWRKDKGLLVVWDDYDPDDEEHTMGIGVLACALEDLPAFLTDVRQLAAAQRKTTVFWIAPVHEQVEAALEQAGYSSEWDSTAYLFEKEHPQQ